MRGHLVLMASSGPDSEHQVDYWRSDHDTIASAAEQAGALMRNLPSWPRYVRTRFVLTASCGPDVDHQVEYWWSDHDTIASAAEKASELIRNLPSWPRHVPTWRFEVSARMGEDAGGSE